MQEDVKQLKIEMKEQKNTTKLLNDKLISQEQTLKTICDTQQKADKKRSIMHQDLGTLKTELGEHTLYLKNHVKWEEKNKKQEAEVKANTEKIHAKYFKIALGLSAFIAVSMISVIAWMFVVIMDTNGKQKSQEEALKSIKENIIDKSKSKDKLERKQDDMHDDIKDIHHLIETKHNPIVEQAKAERLDKFDVYLNRNHERISNMEKDN